MARIDVAIAQINTTVGAFKENTRMWKNLPRISPWPAQSVD